MHLRPLVQPLSFMHGPRHRPSGEHTNPGVHSDESRQKGSSGDRQTGPAGTMTQRWASGHSTLASQGKRQRRSTQTRGRLQSKLTSQSAPASPLPAASPRGIALPPAPTMPPVVGPAMIEPDPADPVEPPEVEARLPPS